MISRANWSNISNFDGNAVVRLAPPLVSLVLIVLIGWQLAKMIWMLVPGSSIGDVVPLPASLPESTAAMQIGRAHV